jgi:hypothetical protein
MDKSVYQHRLLHPLKKSHIVLSFTYSIIEENATNIVKTDNKYKQGGKLLSLKVLNE